MAISLDATYPKTGSSGNDYIASTFTVSSFADGAASKLYVLAFLMSSDVYMSDPPTVTTSGITWNLLNPQRWSGGGGYGGSYIYWYYDTSGTLTSGSTISVARQNGGVSDPWGWIYGLYRLSGASPTQTVDGGATVGAIGGHTGTTTTSASDTLTPTYSGSFMLGVNADAAFYGAPSGLTPTTGSVVGLKDSGTWGGSYAGMMVSSAPSLSTASTPFTFGFSTPATDNWISIALAEIKAAAGIDNQMLGWGW